MVGNEGTGKDCESGGGMPGLYTGTDNHLVIWRFTSTVNLGEKTFSIKVVTAASHSGGKWKACVTQEIEEGIPT